MPVFDIMARYSIEVMAKRLERDTRLELFTSLLGKSQTFHNRQQVGDLMARSTSDVRQLGFMMSPGLDLLDRFDAGLVDADHLHRRFIDFRLLLSPTLFAVFFFLTLRLYMNQLSPVSNDMRAAVRHAQCRVERGRARGRSDQGDWPGRPGAEEVRPINAGSYRESRWCRACPGEVPADARAADRDGLAVHSTACTWCSEGQI